MLFERKEMCSGCTACQQICPQQAITMVSDEEGFLYPEVDESKCSRCGLCQTICPFNENYNKEDIFKRPLVYAAKHAREKVREFSTSGGIFTALSDFVLERGGVVYGAVFSSGFKVMHVRAETQEERDLMRGSKYVQSELGDVFPDIKETLDKGRHVLFAGTPCQTAGLRAFFRNKQQEKLIICDIICLGTPSPLVWERFVALLEKKKGKPLKHFNFRDKTSGWNKSKPMAEFDDRSTESGTQLVRGFNRIFYQCLALRPSCYSCPFTNTHRPSDITIADFWGIEKHKPHFDDNKGVSLVLINTPKGLSIFENVIGELVFEESTIEACLERQVHLQRPAGRSDRRSQFWEDFNKKDIEYVLRKYTYPTVWGFLKRELFAPIHRRFERMNVSKKG